MRDNRRFLLFGGRRQFRRRRTDLNRGALNLFNRVALRVNHGVQCAGHVAHLVAAVRFQQAAIIPLPHAVGHRRNRLDRAQHVAVGNEHAHRRENQQNRRQRPHHRPFDARGQPRRLPHVEQADDEADLPAAIITHRKRAAAALRPLFKDGGGAGAIQQGGVLRVQRLRLA